MSGRAFRRTGYVFSATAIVLLVASAAYACTLYKGTMTLRGHGKDPATGQQSSVTVIGNNRGMSYCGQPYPSPAGSGMLPADTGHTYVDSNPANPPNNVVVDIAPYSDPRDLTGGPYGNDGRSCTGQLPDGTYNVNFVNQLGFWNLPGYREWNEDCMYYKGQFGSLEEDPQQVGDSAVNVGTMIIVGGVATGTYNLGNNLTPNIQGDEAALCVSNQAVPDPDGPGPQKGYGDGLYGLQGPITIL